MRVIAATNKNLQREVSEGRFRMDLFYRLNVFPIRVPALRERLNDIPALTETLKDNDWQSRIGAALALYRILGAEAKAAVPVLLERINSGGSYSKESMEALKKIDPEAYAKVRRPRGR